MLPPLPGEGGKVPEPGNVAIRPQGFRVGALGNLQNVRLNFMAGGKKIWAFQ